MSLGQSSIGRDLIERLAAQNTLACASAHEHPGSHVGLWEHSLHHSNVAGEFCHLRAPAGNCGVLEKGEGCCGFKSEPGTL